MKTLEEIRNTPVGLLTEDEIAQMDEQGQAFARNYQARAAKEAACPGHEFKGYGTNDQARRGYYPGECRHCGKDMTIDSSD